MSEVSEISEQDWTVWRKFYAMRRQLDRALETRLQRDSGISGADYEVLLALLESPDRRLRSRDLAELVGWEKSRLSHQTTRMETRGLVERSECEDDLRGTWVGITNEGSRAILGAMRKHVDAIRELFFDAVTEEQKAALLDASQNVLDAIDPAACTLVESQVQGKRA